MKTYDFVNGLKQEYDKYTDEDRKVWEILFNRQFEQLQGLADESYLRGITEIGFNSSTIPDFKEVNYRLKLLTGWEVVVVSGIVDQFNFFTMLANKQFPSSTWLRSMDELDYLSEPDMFHDAFGHIPLLTNPIFCDFFHEIGLIGTKYLEHPNIIELIGRVYWFTVEFGLINSTNQLKIYGAGILSSLGETKFSLSDLTVRLPFDITTIMESDFDITKIQEKYFVIDSFQQLLDSVVEMKKYLEEKSIRPIILN